MTFKAYSIRFQGSKLRHSEKIQQVFKFFFFTRPFFNISSLFFIKLYYGWFLYFGVSSIENFQDYLWFIIPYYTFILYYCTLFDLFFFGLQRGLGLTSQPSSLFLNIQGRGKN